MSDVVSNSEESVPPPKPAYKVRSLEGVHIDDFLQLLIKKKASDLHLTVGLPPVLRVQGKLLQAPYEEFTPEITRRMVHQILTEEQKRTLDTHLELDFNYFLNRTHIFRASFFHDLGTIAAAFHLLSQPIPTLASLELPPLVEGLTHMPSGLLLVTGPGGSAKEEVVAAIIDHINNNFSKHIVIIEDYPRYFHIHKYSVVQQREIGRDTPNIATALRSLQSQDADVVMIKSLRDLETMRTALLLANDGCFVIASMATVSAETTVHRYIESFPVEEQAEVRLLLSNNLRGVICAQNIPKANGTGRVIAVEVMIATPDIRSLIRESKTDQIKSTIESSAHLGMQTMDMSLSDLCLAGTITRDMAMAVCPNRIDMEKLLTEG